MVFLHGEGSGGADDKCMEQISKAYEATALKTKKNIIILDIVGDAPVQNTGFLHIIRPQSAPRLFLVASLQHFKFG